MPEATMEIPLIRVQACKPYDRGFSIGHRFKKMIKSRLVHDPTLSTALLPYAISDEGSLLIQALSTSNREQYPDYWEELRGLADGSGVPFLAVLLLNLRKEIAPFLPAKTSKETAGAADQCSDILLCSESLAVMAHNEDGDGTLRDHVYLVHATLDKGMSFFAYTCAGELPSCCFGFNSHGVAFTLNSVPPAVEEVVQGGIARNFVSRDILEATDIQDALHRVRLPSLSVGHNYNIMDVNLRKMVSVETASRGRSSIREIKGDPFFHANMYQHLPQIIQIFEMPGKATSFAEYVKGYDLKDELGSILKVTHESSLHRQNRAAELPMITQEQMLIVLGDNSDPEFPVYMHGPQLYTLCTAVFDLDKRSLTIYKGNPSSQSVLHYIPMQL